MFHVYPEIRSLNQGTQENMTKNLALQENVSNCDQYQDWFFQKQTIQAWLFLLKMILGNWSLDLDI
jgi:hypothetical protein